jgi:hypothetical protein
MATKKEPLVKSNITIENARIGFRNFTGKEGQFNPAGQRNFCVFLEDADADLFAKDGWNIKHLTPKDPGDAPQAYLQVSVSYANYAPKVILINSIGKTILDEDTVNILDWADIENVDLIIRPYNWEVNKKKGVKAYLKTMYVTITEDEFADKYRNVPDSAMSSPDDPVFEED